jgi:DNA-directed RNA polymerase subunit M/transcription elongation factor TFIIS
MLGMDIINDNLVFICNSCHERYEAADNDSLRYEEVKGSDIAIFSKILDKIADDPVNPKIARECKTCKNKFAKYVRLGDEMKVVYACTKCKEMSS